MSGLRIEIDTATLDELIDTFGSSAAARAVNVTRSYTQKMQRAARNMLQEEGKVDTGRLIQSIQPETQRTGDIVEGQVNAAAKYARFIHEGAEHDGSRISAHFVPFKIAPSLLQWAKRNGVVYLKDAHWYIKTKGGVEQRIDIKKGGLSVKQNPVPYFRTPFETLAPAYFQKIKEILP